MQKWQVTFNITSQGTKSIIFHSDDFYTASKHAALAIEMGTGAHDFTVTKLEKL